MASANSSSLMTVLPSNSNRSTVTVSGTSPGMGSGLSGVGGGRNSSAGGVVSEGCCSGRVSDGLWGTTSGGSGGS